MKTLEKLDGFKWEYKIHLHIYHKEPDKRDKAIFGGFNALYSASLLGISHTKSFIEFMFTLPDRGSELENHPFTEFANKVLAYAETNHSKLKGNPKLSWKWGVRTFDLLYLDRIVNQYSEYKAKILKQDKEAYERVKRKLASMGVML